jgi:hypothetical protein
MQRRLLCASLLALAILVGVTPGAVDANGRGGGRSGGHGGRHGAFHGHHHGGHAFVGAGSAFLWDPWWPYGPPLAYGPPVVVEQEPLIYVQRGPVPGYWHYCPSTRAYYPDVQVCPEPWLAVPPSTR